MSEEKKTVNNYESFAKEVQGLLKPVKEMIKGLTKKEAIRLLEYTLKFPVEHDAVDKLLIGKNESKVKEHIIILTTAKNNMMLTFISEQLNEAQKVVKEEVSPEVAKITAGEVKSELAGAGGGTLVSRNPEGPTLGANVKSNIPIPEEVQAVIDEGCECEGNCDPCKCEEK